MAADSLPAKIEFEIENLSKEKANELKSQLLNLRGVNDVKFNESSNKVYVDTCLPSLVLHEHIEKHTQTRAVLKGMGSSLKNSIENLDAAVAEISSNPIKPFKVMGVIRLVQLDFDNCAIDGTVDGLEPGEHALNVFEYGDLSDEFKKIGNHYNPYKKKHGLNTDEERHVGDLGNIKANSDGRATFRFVDKSLKIWDVIGRSMCVSEKPDSRDNDTGERLACGIIARSASVFENVKKICACSGKTLWDERDYKKNSKI